MFWNQGFTRGAMAGLAMAAGLFTMGSAQAEVEVAWVHSNAAAQSEQRAKAGLQAWLEETGKDWDVSYLDSGGSGSETANNIQNAVQRGVDALIISMADLRAAEPMIRQAADQGMPIFTIDSGWVPGVIQDVTTNNWVMSGKVSVFLLDSIGGEGNIIFLRMAEHHGTRKRAATMETILQEYSEVNVLAEHNIDYTAFFEDTTRVMEDYVTRFGDDIDAVWAPWDEPARAALNVLRANNIDAVVTGIDGHPDAVEMVKNPDSRMIATVAQPFEEMGSSIGGWIERIVVDGADPDGMFETNTTYLDAPLITKSDD